MPAVSPLSTGLFDAHLERGRSFLSAGQAEPAERELSEAYFLRPRDKAVLGLLGVLYFKQGRLERAEEVFQKLSKESADDAAVLFNLGLINFKLNRFREAETAFVQALALTKDKPRVHFYLGATYEKHGRVREAIHQFRLARGSHGTPPPDPNDDTPITAEMARPDFDDSPMTKTVPLPRLETTSAPRGARTAPIPQPPAAAAPAAREEDTGLFGEAKLVQVPGAEIQAPAGAVAEQPLALQPEIIQLGAEEADAFLGPVATPPVTNIRLRQRDVVEVPFDGRVFFRKGSLISSTGRVNFWVKEGASAGIERLVIASGQGSLVLSDAGKSIGLIAGEAGRKLWARPDRVIAADESLQPRYVTMSGATTLSGVLELEGAGFAAVSWSRLPHCARVRPGEPLRVSVTALTAWSGDLTAKLLVEGRHGGAAEVVELAGDGEALIEE